MQQFLLDLGFTFSNREIAGFIWLFLILSLALVKSNEARSSLANVCRTASSWKIVVPIVGLFVWIGLEVWLGSLTSLWEINYAKDTALWTITAGIAFLFAHEKANDPSFFWRVIRGAVGLVVLFEYFVNLTSFPLMIELILQPFLVLLLYASISSSYRQEDEALKRPAEFMLGAIGLALLTHTAIDLYANRQDIDWLALGQKAAVPMWLTIGLLPYIYAISLFANSERAFINMDSASSGSRAPWYTKLALLSKLHIRNHALHEFLASGVRRVANTGSFSAARAAVDEFQAVLDEREKETQEMQDRLIRYAGSRGVDSEGRRLDRREFEETQRALLWLSTCQMGWCQKKGCYQEDLLERFDDDFTRQGLPRESGIHMYVSDDGQSWYAWRRTVSGWCFAIGASDPSSIDWRYDGPEPPQGFPGEDPAWGDSPWSDDAAPNWD